MKIHQIILVIILIPVVLFLFFLIYSTLDDYKPDDITLISRPQNYDTLKIDMQISLLIWNIGYAGLDENMDFFYDGGKKVRPERDKVYENIRNICKFIEDNDTMDFIMLQEVDSSSHRSYRLNELFDLRKSLKPFQVFFGKNYDVNFVPVPFKKPMGGVLSGIVTFTKYKPHAVYRYSFPGNYSWPTRIFMLDRCFLVSRFYLSDSRELVLINTHNSAYDDGSLRKSQMEYLKGFIVSEYQSGNYVVVGGDWNQCPPLFKPDYLNQPFDTINLSYVSEEFLPKSWTWAYDSRVPSNRRVTDKYIQGKTLTTVIDFILVSPNIQLKNINTIDLGFKYSDHQPVLAAVKFME